MKSDLMLKEEARAREALPPAVVAFIGECVAQERPESRLIAVLHKVQEHHGYLGRDQMQAESTLMGIPSAKVTGVASFYHLFTFAPRGTHTISVCLGTACFVKGADKVLARLKDLLGIDVGGTTADGLFSIEIARCVGACALAPVVIVGEKVHANVRPEDVPKLLASYGYKAKK